MSHHRHLGYSNWRHGYGRAHFRVGAWRGARSGLRLGARERASGWGAGGGGRGSCGGASPVVWELLVWVVGEVVPFFRPTRVPRWVVLGPVLVWLAWSNRLILMCHS